MLLQFAICTFYIYLFRIQSKSDWFKVILNLYLYFAVSQHVGFVCLFTT